MKTHYTVWYLELLNQKEDAYHNERRFIDKREAEELVAFLRERHQSCPEIRLIKVTSELLERYELRENHD